MINPEDAYNLSGVDGDIVDVSCRKGSIQLPVEVRSSRMKNVVSILYGFGHNKKVLAFLTP